MISTYNSIKRLQNLAKESYGSIEIYLKNRFDLLPNLVDSIKKYMSHETELLTKITELRTAVTNNQQNPDAAKQIDMSNEFTKLLSGISINVENYPDIKADKQFLNFQYDVQTIEEEISAARRTYNAYVTDYNNYIVVIPSNIVANLVWAKALPLLHIPQEEQVYKRVRDLF